MNEHGNIIIAEKIAATNRAMKLNYNYEGKSDMNVRKSDMNMTGRGACMHGHRRALHGTAEKPRLSRTVAEEVGHDHVHHFFLLSWHKN